MINLTIILVGFVFGGLTLGFAAAADHWKQRADFWETRYLEATERLVHLADDVDRHMDKVDDRLLRVWVADE